MVSALCAGILVLVDYIKTHRRFPPNSFLGGRNLIEVSGLTRDEALRKLQNTNLRELFFSTVSFTASREVFSYPPEDLGVHLLAEATVDEAFGSTHNANYFKELHTRLQRKDMVLPLRFGPNEAAALKTIKELAPLIDSAPQNAYVELHEKTGGYHIVPDIPARKLLIKETMQNVKDALFNGKDRVELAIDRYQPAKITEALLRRNPPVHRISAFTTYYGSHDSPNRIHNIMLMASFIDNTLLLSGEVFSLVEKIGDFTEDRGFKEAYVISGGMLVPELGGGACQIGTTLFNALSLADIGILSRRNHSFYFNIYPLGRDATIYPGQADLKFINDTGAPIMIKAVATKSKLSFRVYGTPTGKYAEFSPPTILIQDPRHGFRPATLKEITTLDLPFRTTVKRTVKNAQGQVLKEEELRSYYKLYGEKTNVPIKRRETR